MSYLCDPLFPSFACRTKVNELLIFCNLASFCIQLSSFCLWKIGMELSAFRLEILMEFVAFEPEFWNWKLRCRSGWGRVSPWIFIRNTFSTDRRSCCRRHLSPRGMCLCKAFADERFSSFYYFTCNLWQLLGSRLPPVTSLLTHKRTILFLRYFSFSLRRLS